MTLNNTNIR